MKKIITLLTMTLGIFALVGLASASTTEDSASSADRLQPASSLVVEDELQVLGTARAYSIRIGAQGYGGVTFFNGTIINETTDVDTGAEQPVTFGDDIRVDGQLWRGENSGAGLNDNRELTVNDDMIVTGELSVNGLVGAGIVGSNNIKNGTIATADIANNAITSAKINNGTITSADINNGTITGADISSSADLSVSTGTFSGDITAHGDIKQSINGTGALKAGVYVIEGNCPNNYQWTYNNSNISCSQSGTGEYTVTFDFITNQGLLFYSANVVANSEGYATIELADTTSTSNDVTINVFDSTGSAANRSFILMVY